MRRTSDLSLRLSALLLLASCGGKPPATLPEFPDVPAYPGAALEKREPSDSMQPASSGFYRVGGMDWVDVQKFYEREMPNMGWERQPPPSGDDRDPHLLWAKGPLRVVVNARSYAGDEQFAVFHYRDGEEPAKTVP